MLRNLKITYIDATVSDTILAAKNLKVRETDGQSEINVNQERDRQKQKGEIETTVMMKAMRLCVLIKKIKRFCIF